MEHQTLLVKGGYSRAQTKSSPSKELLVVAAGLEPAAAAVKAELQDGGGSPGMRTKVAVLERLTQRPKEESRKNGATCLVGRKAIRR